MLVVIILACLAVLPLRVVVAPTCVAVLLATSQSVKVTASAQHPLPPHTTHPALPCPTSLHRMSTMNCHLESSATTVIMTLERSHLRNHGKSIARLNQPAPQPLLQPMPLFRNLNHTTIEMAMVMDTTISLLAAIVEAATAEAALAEAATAETATAEAATTTAKSLNHGPAAEVAPIATTIKRLSHILPGTPAETVSVVRAIHTTQTVTRRLSHGDQVETIIKVHDHDLHLGHLGGQEAREVPGKTFVFFLSDCLFVQCKCIFRLEELENKEERKFNPKRGFSLDEMLGIEPHINRS